MKVALTMLLAVFCAILIILCAMVPLVDDYYEWFLLSLPIGCAAVYAGIWAVIRVHTELSECCS